jgi:bis(5'-nucleosyl)-tetraphosphatase (symmetrical)
MTDYAVGDVQGCLSALKRVLSDAGFEKGRDTLWLVGDLVNRGEDSLGTLKFLYKMRNSVRTVLGNHDLHLIAIDQGFKSLGRKDTLDDILQSSSRRKLIDWLIQQPLLQHDKELGYTMTHAGIPPCWSTRQARDRADELQQVLINPKDRLAFLETMYGNQPDKWDDTLRGTDRWRVITNYFTRMRFTNAKGKLDLTNKNGPLKPPKGMKPWFEHEPIKPRKTKLLFGHWAALNGLFDHPWAIGLDTGCVWGGPLTLMNLKTGETHSSPANG